MELDQLVYVPAGDETENVRTITFTFTGVSEGDTGYLPVKLNGTITGWELVADDSGNAEVDVWLAPPGEVPTEADSIVGATPPTLSAEQIASEDTLEDWNTEMVPGVLGFKVSGIDVVSNLTLSIFVSTAV